MAKSPVEVNKSRTNMGKIEFQIKAAILYCTLFVHLSLAGCGLFVGNDAQNEPENSTETPPISDVQPADVLGSGIGESVVEIDGGFNSSRSSDYFQAVDPMELIDYENAFTIEIGTFDSEAEAMRLAQSSGLERDEMGVACQSNETEQYYLLGYGLYLDYEQARQILTGLQQMIPDRLEYLRIRQLSEIEQLSAQFACLSAQSS